MEVKLNPLEDPFIAADYLQLTLENIHHGRMPGDHVPEVSATIRDITVVNRFFLLIVERQAGRFFFPVDIASAFITVNDTNPDDVRFFVPRLDTLELISVDTNGDPQARIIVQPMAQ